MLTTPNKKTNSALAEAIRLMSETVSIHEIGDDFVERLSSDLSTLLKNIPNVKKADEINEYFKAIKRFSERLDLMAAPHYAAFIRNIRIDYPPLQKLFYKLKKQNQINEFGSFYRKALYDLIGELNVINRCGPKKCIASYLEIWWEKEKDKWKNRVQRKARKLWKDMKYAFRTFEIEGERIRVPEEELEEIQGHPTVTLGYDPDDQRHKQQMEIIVQGIKQAKEVVSKKFPSLLPRSLTFVINFSSGLRVRGKYLSSFGGSNSPAIEISTFQNNPKDTEFTIIHEAAHYYWDHKMSEDARQIWAKVYKANMSGRLDLKKLKKYWDEKPSMKWISQVMNNTSMKEEDPQLYLQLQYLIQNFETSLFYIRNREDLEKAIKNNDVWVVPKQPITWYAGKDEKEMFAESVATYLSFGSRAMPDYILAVLKNIIGSQLKESYQKF